MSNESGYFVIPCDAGSVIVRVSYAGYKTILQSSASPDLGTIRLCPAAHALREVRVTGMRPAITYKDDRTVVDIGHSILGTGNNAESLLDQLPGVWHSGNSLSINGIPGVQVMVNDRQVQLSGEQLMNYLWAMSPSRSIMVTIISSISTSTKRRILYRMSA